MKRPEGPPFSVSRPPGAQAVGRDACVHGKSVAVFGQKRDARGGAIAVTEETEGGDVRVVSTPYVPGMRIEKTLGMTWGTVVRARGIGYQVVASLRAMAGGEIDEYTDMLNHARERALRRMQAHAASLGANAVIGVAFDSSELGQNMSEVLAYGTAVLVSEDADATRAQFVRLA